MQIDFSLRLFFSSLFMKFLVTNDAFLPRIFRLKVFRFHNLHKGPRAQIRIVLNKYYEYRRYEHTYTVHLNKLKFCLQSPDSYCKHTTLDFLRYHRNGEKER